MDDKFVVIATGKRWEYSAERICLLIICVVD